MIAHKAIGPALQKSTAIRLQAVASRSPERATAYALQFGGRVVSDYGGLVSAEDVDIVYVSLPNHLHAVWSLRAIAAGKHVICDKPAVVALRDAEQIVEACARQGVRFFEAFMFRFHPQHEVVRNLLLSGRVGTPFLVSASFGFPSLPPDNFRWNAEMGGGALNDVGVYPAAAARLLFGEMPKRVHASWTRNTGGNVDMRGCAQLDFMDGRVAQLAYGFDNFYRNTYSVWGTRGHLALGRAFTVPSDYAPTVTVESDAGVEVISVDPADQFALMLDSFAIEARGGTVGKVPICWEEDVLSQARLIDALRRSAMSEQVVVI